MTRDEYEEMRAEISRSEQAETERLCGIVSMADAAHSERLLRGVIALRKSYERDADQCERQYGLAQLRLRLAQEREQAVFAAIHLRITLEAAAEIKD